MAHVFSYLRSTSHIPTLVVTTCAAPIMAPVFVPLVIKTFPQFPRVLVGSNMPDATWVEKGLRDLEPFNSKVIVISVGKFIFNL